MFISAGHSLTDPGAVATQVIGVGANGKLLTTVRKEADIAVETRNLVSFYLTRAGKAHVLDGHGTANLPLNKTVAISRKHRISVEFHCNAAVNPQATGCEALCAPKDRELAAKICEAIASTLEIRNRGVKPENAGQHKRLAFVQAGGIIVELFFISNPEDLAAYDGRKWLMARAIANVLIDS